MKQLLILAALVVAAHSIGKWKEGLSVRFAMGFGAGRTHFIKVPQTLREAKNSRWVESPRPIGQHRPDLVLYNPSRDDLVLGGLYDSSGKIAGLQIALPKYKFYDNAYDWKAQGFSEWTAPADSTGYIRTYYTTAVYFVSGNAKSSDDSAAFTRANIIQDDYVYLTGHNGDLIPIPVKGSDVPKKTDFKRQNCIPMMGRHYFYNMTRQSPECTADTSVPWFALTDESFGTDQLIGVGLITFGKLPASDIKRDYFERPSEFEARLIVGQGPDCFFQNINRYGLVTMHIYFVDSPTLINCLFT